MSESSPKKTLYLIDGHAQFFRAYHAIRSGLSSPVTNEPTNMTFGFVGMLLKVLREYKPDYLAVVIDVSGDKESFRSQIYPEYKANREEPPSDLRPQIDRCLEILKQMHVPVLGVEGVEADDVIATVVRRLEKKHPELAIRIVSRDKDLSQLLSEHVQLFDVHKDVAVTAAEIFETPGLEPRHVQDVLTLMGDKVDNVPGIAGIGPKTAGQLMVQYGTIENLYAHIEEIKGKKRENLEKGKEGIAISRQLIALKCDVDVPFEVEEAKVEVQSLPVEELTETFRQLGFHRHQDELRAIVLGTNGQAAGEVEKSSAPGVSTAVKTVETKPARDDGFAESLFGGGVAESLPARAADSAGYECIKDRKALEKFIKEIRKAGFVAIDTETDGLEPVSANLCGVCMSVKTGTGVYVPTRSQEQTSHMDTATVMELLKPVLEDGKVRKIGHNLKFDMNVLRKHGAQVKGELFDTMIASYVVDSSRSSHGMDALALALLSYNCIPIDELIGKGAKQKGFDEVPLDRATCYAAEDADITLRLYDLLSKQVDVMRLRKLFEEVEMPLVSVLADMEFNGIKVDPDELDRQGEKLNAKITELKRTIAESSPVPFNPDSPKQLAAVLFNKPGDDPPGLGIKSLKRGKTGPSTDVEVLEKLASDPTVDSPLPAMIVEYRQMTKLVNTYLVALKDAINPVTKRVHAKFNQTVAATGRLSSSDPNLQNIPIRTDIGREIRRAFVAEEGKVLITADYSQIELRLLAHLSDDPALITAFEKGEDIHTAVAAQIFGVPAEQVTSGQRNSAKMVNFGIIYGITAFGLARRLGKDVTNEDAAKIIADYKKRFSRIDWFLDQCVQQAIQRGYVETILGRRRAVPQVHARNPQERALGERVAINSVVQGSAADLIKLAMINLHRELPAKFPEAKLVIQIHDELVYEAPKKKAEAVKEFVVDHMQKAMSLKVPLVVESAWSTNWIDAK
ncbi:MAG TPA: DNA polymerase I [Phycisphaerales bacterium]|nr:DNA polymerase I [Phycisphaerales bacterium]